MSSQPGRLGGKSNAAVVAAVAGIVGTMLGTVGGGFATYLATRELQQSEREHRARGAARVLQIEFGVAHRYVDLARDGELKRFPRDLPVRLSQSDRQLVASEVDADDWETIVRGLGLADQLEAFLTKDRRMPREVLADIDRVLPRLEHAVHALRSLAGGEVELR